MSDVGKRIVLFLGAGAVQPIGYKTTKEFSEMINRIHPFKGNNLWNTLLNSKHVYDIEQTLYMLETIIVINDYSSDGESSHTFLNMNIQKNQTIHIPYMASLDFYSKFLNEFYGIKIHDYPTNVEQLIEDSKNLKEEIQSVLIQEYSKKSDSVATGSIGRFIEKFIDDAIDFSIFTTNYEKTVKEIVEETYIIDDGFDDHNQFNPDKKRQNKNGMVYGQLHGSLAWIRLPNDIIRNDPDKRDFDSENKYHTIIYPTLNLKDEQYKPKPYKYYLQQFQEKMQKADLCIIIGFSFRDRLSDIFSGFKGKLFIIDMIEDESVDAYKEYLEALNDNNAKINLKRINSNNVFLKGFPSNDELLNELLEKIEQYCRIDLNAT